MMIKVSKDPPPDIKLSRAFWQELVYFAKLTYEWEKFKAETLAIIEKNRLERENNQDSDGKL